ncbi:MAG: hypothetical protein WA785_20815, partial [Candidatus Acidiferrales bacterium]
VEDARQFLTTQGIDVDAIATQLEGKFVSAFVRAKKPVAEAAAAQHDCCGPACCSPAETATKVRP